MRVVKLKLAHDNLDQLVNYLIQEVKFDYENHSLDMSILISHNLRMVDMSAHLNMFILKKEASFILIDVITGGGSDGLVNITGAAEKSYTKSNAKVIHEYAERYDLPVEAV